MRRVAFIAVPLAAFALLAAGCGSKGTQKVANPEYQRGATLFAEHCAGCHTLSVDGTEGSASNVRDLDHTNGPNFDMRKETVEGVLYAIENGGFSGAIMPQNIVTGADAQAVAEYLARYSGSKAAKAPTLQSTTSPQTTTTTESGSQ